MTNLSKNNNKNDSIIINVRIKRNGKYKLTNNSGKDICIRGTWNTYNITKHFYNKLYNVNTIGDCYINGTFIIKNGDTRTLNKKNLESLLNTGYFVDTLGKNLSKSPAILQLINK